MDDDLLHNTSVANNVFSLQRQKRPLYFYLVALDGDLFFGEFVLAKTFERVEGSRGHFFGQVDDCVRAGTKGRDKCEAQASLRVSDNGLDREWQRHLFGLAEVVLRERVLVVVVVVIRIGMELTGRRR